MLESDDRHVANRIRSLSSGLSNILLLRLATLGALARRPFARSVTTAMINTPTGMLSEADCLKLFAQVGFTPPPGMSVQNAFTMLRQQAEAEAAAVRPGRSRSAELPSPPTAEAACLVLGMLS